MLLRRAITCMKLRPRWAYSRACSRQVSLIDSASGNLLRKIDCHSKAVRSLSWAADSRSLLSASEDSSILVHNGAFFVLFCLFWFVFSSVVSGSESSA